MIQLTIDGKIVKTDDGATILDAARAVGIDIPTMCHIDKKISPVSCFVCVVKVEGQDNFVPSCATVVREGMAVDTSSDEVTDCRRRALELMLSEHAGNCEAPCTRICPCGLDIPEMVRNLLAKDDDAALRTLKKAMPFPATLGYICPALCKKGCRRAVIDAAIPIQKIHKDIAEKAINTPAHNNNIDIAKTNSKNIAIIGSGPAGLSSAYFLTIKGYSCTIFESQSKIGGTLKSRFDESTLPQKILDAEIESIKNLGVKFIVDKKINTIDEIYDDYDAIIIATGLDGSDIAKEHPEWLQGNNITKEHPGGVQSSVENTQNKRTAPQRGAKNDRQQLFGLEYDTHGIKTCHDTLMTSRPKVFACGSSRRPVRIVARSVGQGMAVAISVDNYLSAKTTGKPFFVNIGHLSTDEMESLAKSIPYTGKGINTDDINGDTANCLQCDCGKKDSCVLRAHAIQYNAHHMRYATGHRKEYIRRLYNDSGLIHEPGKCTACGRCVNITRERGVNPGLSFTGRGSDVYVSAPFGADIDKAMGEVLNECVDSCPTGALWVRT